MLRESKEKDKKEITKKSMERRKWQVYKKRRRNREIEREKMRLSVNLKRRKEAVSVLNEENGREIEGKH